MLRFLFDTDHLTLYEHGHSPLLQRVGRLAFGELGVCAVTVEESFRGRLAALAQARDGATRIRRYGKLLATISLLQRFLLVPYDQASEDQFQHLLAQRLRIGSQDLKIAAIALAHNLTVLTRNRRDFARVPGLALDDWSV
jgi:tRNA(fMet)-specific endonuclease VapC